MLSHFSTTEERKSLSWEHHVEELKLGSFYLKNVGEDFQSCMFDDWIEAQTRGGALAVATTSYPPFVVVTRCKLPISVPSQRLQSPLHTPSARDPQIQLLSITMPPVYQCTDETIKYVCSIFGAHGKRSTYIMPRATTLYVSSVSIPCSSKYGNTIHGTIESAALRK